MHDNPGQSLRAETWIQYNYSTTEKVASTHEFLGEEGVIIVDKRTNIPSTRFFFQPELCTSDNLEITPLAAADQPLSKDV
jgi:hypothetical protein